jgi:hypothetical protein
MRLAGRQEGIIMGHMFKKVFEGDEDGVSGAITAMMIIMIISSFISLIYAVYIPTWTKDAEADHSKLVLSQFLDIKEKIDDQIINSGQNQGISVTSRVTLGRSGGPVFGMGTTSGLLSVNPYQDTITMFNSNSIDETFAQARGNISYRSQTQYFQKQVYVYQYGAVIVAQVKSTAGGRTTYDAVLKVQPHFKAEKDLLGNVTISMVQVALLGDQKQLSGTQDLNVRTTLNSVDTNDLTRDVYPTLRNLTMNVTTDFTSVWMEYYQNALAKNVTGMTEKIGAGAGDYNITTTGRIVTVKFWNVNAINIDNAIIAVDIE